MSTNSEFYVYEDANIIWAARSETVAPVAIQRSNLSGLPGGIVTLSETGQINIGYLGSEPFTFTVPPLDRDTDLHLTQLSRDLKRLEAEIKNVQDVQNMEMINLQAERDLEIKFTIDRYKLKKSTELESLDDAVLSARVALLELPVSRGALKWQTHCDLSELQLAFYLPEGVRCSQDTLSYQNVTSQTVEEMSLEFYISDLVYVHTAQIEVVASFINTKVFITINN